jgi:hypothetical protein
MADKFLSEDINLINGDKSSTVGKTGEYQDAINDRVVKDVISFSDEWTKSTLSNDGQTNVESVSVGELDNPQSSFVIKEGETEARSKYVFDDSKGTLTFKDETLAKTNEFGCVYDKSDEVPLYDMVRDLEILSAFNRIPDFGAIYDFQVRQLTFGVYKYANALLCINMAKSLGYLSLDKIINDEYTTKKGMNELHEKYKDDEAVKDKYPAYSGWLDSDEYINGGWVDIDELVKKTLNDEFAYDADWSLSVRTKQFQDRKRALVNLILTYTSNIWGLNSPNKLVDFGIRIIDKTSGKQLDYSDVKNGLRNFVGQTMTAQFSGELGTAATNEDGTLSSGQPNSDVSCAEKNCDKNYVNSCDGTIFKKDCFSDSNNTGSVEDKASGNFHLLSPQFKLNPLSNYRKDKPDILNTIDPIHWTTGNIDYIKKEFSDAYKWISDLTSKFGTSTYESTPLNQNRAFHYVGGTFDNGLAASGFFHQNDITLNKELWGNSSNYEIWNGTAWAMGGSVPIQRGLGIGGGDSNYFVNAWGVQPKWIVYEGEVNNDNVTPYAFATKGSSNFYEYNNGSWTYINLDPIVEKHSVAGVMIASKTGNDASTISNDQFKKTQLPNSSECLEACTSTINDYQAFVGSAAGEVSYKNVFSGFCFNGTRGPALLDGRNYCDDFDDSIIFFSYIDAVRSKTVEEMKEDNDPTTVSLTTQCSFVDPNKKYPVKTIGTCYVGTGTAGIATGGKTCASITSCDATDARTNKYQRYFNQDSYFEEYDSIVKYAYEWNGTAWARRDDMPEDVAFHCGVGDEKWSIFWGGIHSSIERANVTVYVPGCDTWYDVIEAFNGAFNKYGICGLSGEIKYADFANTFIEVTDSGTAIYRVPPANAAAAASKYYPVIEVSTSCSSKFDISIDIGVNSAVDTCPSTTTSLLGTRTDWGVKSRYIGNVENQIISTTVRIKKAGSSFPADENNPGIGIYLGLYDISTGKYVLTSYYEWTSKLWFEDYEGVLADIAIDPLGNSFVIQPEASISEFSGYTYQYSIWDITGSNGPVSSGYVYDAVASISADSITGSYVQYGYNDYGGFYAPLGHRGHYKQTTVPTVSGSKMYITTYESGTTYLVDPISASSECACVVCMSGQSISASDSNMIFDEDSLAVAVNEDWVGYATTVDTEIYNYRYTNVCDLILNNYHKNSPSEGGSLLSSQFANNWIWSVPVKTYGDEDVDTFFIKRSPVVTPSSEGCEVIRSITRGTSGRVSRAIVAGPNSNGIGMYGFGKSDIADTSGSPFSGFFDYQTVGEPPSYTDAMRVFPWVVIGDGGTVGPRGCVDMFDENGNFWFAVGDANNKKTSELSSTQEHTNTYTIVMVPKNKFDDFNNLIVAKANLKAATKSIDGFAISKPFIDLNVVTGVYTTNKTARNREGLLEAINAFNGDSIFKVYIKLFDYIVPDVVNEDSEFINDSISAVPSGGDYVLPFLGSTGDVDKVENYDIITSKDISCLTCYTCNNDEETKYLGKNWIQHYHEEWATPYIQHPLSGIFARNGFNVWITSGDCPQRWGTAVWTTVDNGRVWVHYKKSRLAKNETRNHLIYSVITSSFTIDEYAADAASDIPVINKYDEFIFNLSDYADDEFISKLINDVSYGGEKICEEQTAAFVPQSIWSECVSGCDTLKTFTNPLCLSNCADTYLETVTGCLSGSDTLPPTYAAEDFDPDLGYTEWATNFVMEYRRSDNPGQAGDKKYYYKYDTDELGSNCLKDREHINDQSIVDTSWRRFQDGAGLGGDAPLFNRPGTNFSCNTTMVNFIGQKAFGNPDRAIICGGYSIESNGELAFNHWFWNSFTQGPTFKWNRFVINPEDTVNRNYTYRNLSPFFTNGDQTLTDSIHGTIIFDVSGPATVERYGQALFNNTNEAVVEFEAFPDFIANKDKYSISLTPSDNVKVWWESKSEGTFTIKCELEKWSGTVDWKIMYIEEIAAENIDGKDSQTTFDGYADK